MTTVVTNPPVAPTARLGRVLVVDDETELMAALCEMLHGQGYDAVGHSAPGAALAALGQEEFDLLLTDLMMPQMSGIALLRAAREVDPDLVGIVMTGQGTVQTAVEAMKSGAFDYLLKPFKLNAVLPILARAMGMRRLHRENLQLREAVSIHELSETISFTLDRNAVLEKLADAALRQTGADELSVMLATPQGDALTIAAVRGAGNETLLGRRQPLDAGIAGWVAREREPLLLHGEVTGLRCAPIAPRPAIRSAISLPMLAGNKLVGVLNLNIIRNRRCFVPGQVKALSILASTAASALETARLYEQVREEEERYRLVLENVDEIVYMVALDAGDPIGSRVAFVSGRVEHMIGYSAEEFYADPGLWLQLLHPDELEIVEKQTVEMVANRQGGVRIYRMRHKHTGEYRWLEDRITLRQDASGRVTGIFGVARDVTERRAAERALRRNEALLRTVLDTLPVGVWVTDHEGRMTLGNPAGQRIWGGGRFAGIEQYGEYKGWWTETGKRIEPQEWALARAVRTGETSLNEEIEIEGFDGARKIILNSAVPLRDAEGRILGAVVVDQDITERKRAEERLRYLAHHDALTGLPNRALFTDRLGQAMIDAERRGREVGVLLLDLDRFKNINDSLGHEVGDQFLLAVTERLAGAVRRGDTVARLGGDEFALVLADMARGDDAARVAQKVLDVLAGPFHLAGRELFLSASAGVTLCPADGRDVQTLLRNADVAMYRAKEAGRNTYRYYAAEMTARAEETLALENDLRRALDRDEFFIEYQPLVDLATGVIGGLEALIRWRHPARGVVSPLTFIPLAESSGLILPIGEWVLRAACAQNVRWAAQGLARRRVAVNLSAHQFAQSDLVGIVTRILRETGLDPRLLGIEITETILMQNPETAAAMLGEIERMGVHIALDDFGVGYSSLSYLKRFPIDTLKIDRSFVRDISVDPDDAAIVTAIISMAHSLGIQTVAEGVETEAQLAFLQAHGCDVVQGYYFSRPKPADDLAALLRGGAFPPRGGR